MKCTGQTTKAPFLYHGDVPRLYLDLTNDSSRRALVFLIIVILVRLEIELIPVVELLVPLRTLRPLVG